MKKLGAVVFLLASTVALPSVDASAQGAYIESYIQLMRADVKAKKVAIITELMEFTEEESAAFWPLYREYEFELSKLGDTRVALIKEYAEYYDTLGNEKAKELAKKFFDLEERRTSLKRKYFRKMEKRLLARMVTKFFQIENRINLLIDLQLAAQLPLIE
jgi:hypothetical protein